MEKTRQHIDATAPVVDKAAPRRLLHALRGIMAGDQPMRRRIEEMMAVIARELAVDSCACFVTRSGDMLELFASSGLDGLVSRRQRLRVGEGLVGDIAAQAIPLVAPDMKAHASFTNAPETGGYEFAAFCGVPILRGGAVRGVLAVQNRVTRQYAPMVVDTLQAVALMLSELIAAGGIVKVQEISPLLSAGGRPTRMEGVVFAAGLAQGRAVLHEPGLTLNNIVADEPAPQKMRLKRAAVLMNKAISRLMTHDALREETETREIMEAYQMFARDRGWFAKIENAIDFGLTAEAAVQAVLNETRARMMQISDPYIRDRLQDIEDISNRLLTHLGQGRQTQAAALPDDIVLVARSLGPAALLDYDRGKLKAVVLEKGGYSDHVAIVARALGIPLVGQCGDVLNYTVAGDQVIVDGDKGTVYLRPSQYVLDTYAKNLEARTRRSNLYKRVVRHRRSVTRDGITVSVQMNAGLPEEAAAFSALGADGIGLFRTELAFMQLNRFPTVAKQAEIYSKIFEQAGGKPVTFRTLDIGGDKPLAYFDAPDEDNPALGWRAVRIAMDRPAMLRSQFRALIQAAAGRPLRVMLPLVTEVAEFDRARDLMEMEKSRAIKNGNPLPEKIELGVMIEVPALLWQLDTLLTGVDFVSVGTNDLMQYLFAADRGNEAVRDRYDSLSPAMLRVLKAIVAQCRSAKVPVSVCGEMAGRPLEAMVLIALGYRVLSVPAQAIETLKMMIPTLDTGGLLAYLEHLMKSRDRSVREQLLSFARDHQVNIAQNG